MFHHKKINSQNHVGNVLKEARSKTGLSLKIIAKHTHINKKYLEALEQDHWHKLPGEIYAKNFLKKYCDFLNIDLNQLNIDWQKISCFKNKSYSADFHKKTHSADLFNLPRTIKIICLSFITLCVLIYLAWQINQIIKPPAIILYHPLTDLIQTENLITVAGETQTEVALKINSEPVFLNEQHQFFETLNLQPGLNIIQLEAKKKYSKKQILERKIIVE